MSKKKKSLKWTPPNDYKSYFNASSDDEFKAKHPIGYAFLVILGIFALLLPTLIFGVLLGIGKGWILEGANGFWSLLGFAGGLVFGIGLFNFVAIIINQYLGHWVSIVSFLVGGFMMFASLNFLK